jgi:hypothetical protein
MTLQILLRKKNKCSRKTFKFIYICQFYHLLNFLHWHYGGHYGDRYENPLIQACSSDYYAFRVAGLARSN